MKNLYRVYQHSVNMRSSFLQKLTYIADLHDHFNLGRLSIEAFSQLIKDFKMERRI